MFRVSGMIWILCVLSVLLAHLRLLFFVGHYDWMIQRIVREMFCCCFLAIMNIFVGTYNRFVYNEIVIVTRQQDLEALRDDVLTIIVKNGGWPRFGRQYRCILRS